MLKNKIVGIDISDKSIKIVESRTKKNSVNVLNYSYAKLKKGVIENGEIKDEKTLSITIQEMLDKAKPNSIKTKQISLGLPDFQVFSYYENDIKFDRKFENEKIESLAHKNIPIEKANLLFNSKVSPIKNKNGYFEVLIIGTYKDVITQWENFFDSLELELAQVMSSSGAASLAIDPEKKLGTNCIVDIGEKLCNININKDNNTVYSYSMNNAGDLITENISKSKNNADNKPLPWEEAEQIKTSFDISNPNSNEQAIGLLISNTIRSISIATQSLIELSSTKKNICTYNIFLCGGSSKINNIQNIIQEHFNKTQLNQECIDHSIENIETETSTNSEEENAPEQKKEVITTKTLPRKIQVNLAYSGFLQKANLDPLFLQSVGLCYSFVQDNELVFTRDRIKHLVKETEQKQKKKEEEDTKEKKAQDENESWIKNNKKLVFLIAIFSIGLMLLPVAYWIRKSNAEKLATEMNQNLEYSIEAKHELIAKALLEGENNQSGELIIKARIETVPIETGASYEQAMSQAQTKAKSVLRKHEKVWSLPLNKQEDTSSIIFPISFDFFIYNENDISAFVLKGGQDRYGIKDFILSGLIVKDVKKEAEDIDVYIDVTYLVNPGVENKMAEQDASSKESIPNLVSSSSEESTISKDTYPETKKTDSEVEPLETTNTDNNSIGTGEANNESENFDLEVLQQLLKKANQEKLDQYVTILESGLGWLNVRQGPGTTYDIIGQANTAQIYELLEDGNGWSKISLSEGIEGWVSNDYIEITKK